MFFFFPLFVFAFVEICYERVYYERDVHPSNCFLVESVFPLSRCDINSTIDNTSSDIEFPLVSPRARGLYLTWNLDFACEILSPLVRAIWVFGRGSIS